MLIFSFLKYLSEEVFIIGKDILICPFCIGEVVVVHIFLPDKFCVLVQPQKQIAHFFYSRLQCLTECLVLFYNCPHIGMVS